METFRWVVLEEDQRLEINQWGDVRNRETGVYRKPTTHRLGYLRMEIGRKYYYLHRLVGKYYLDNILVKPEINHMDGIRNNNFYLNLEWCTRTENMHHSMKHWNMGIGQNNWQTNLSDEFVLEIVKEMKTKTYLELSNIHNIKSNVLRSISSGESWTHITKDFDYIPVPKLRHAKLDKKLVKEIALKLKYMSIKEICVEYELKISCVSNIANGHNHKDVTKDMDHIPVSRNC